MFAEPGTRLSANRYATYRDHNLGEAIVYGLETRPAKLTGTRQGTIATAGEHAVVLGASKFRRHGSVAASPLHERPPVCPVRQLRNSASTAPSRPFLESHVRRRARALRNVTLLGAHAVDLTTTSRGDRVTGDNETCRFPHQLMVQLEPHGPIGAARLTGNDQTREP